MSEKEMLQSFITELRRGSLTLAVLGCLRQSHYGYELLQIMQKKNIEIEANTLYPLLRRLERQELLTSDWDTSESRPRKYYILSEKGTVTYQELLLEWEKMKNNIDTICGEDESDESTN